jgi:hypothetical protein
MDRYGAWKRHSSPKSGRFPGSVIGVPRLFHISEDGPFNVMTPRPSPAGTPYAGQRLVWAIDEPHLVNYLFPRECPRVCWATGESGASELLASPARRVIAIEHAWIRTLVDTRLQVHALDPDGFSLLDAVAGYWVNEHQVRVRDVCEIENCLVAIAEQSAEVRLAASLWPYVDAVLADGGEFSVIRIRNARPRTST